MAQRDNMPEGTDSIIEGAAGASGAASTTSPSNADVVGGSFGSGGAAGLGGASGAGLSSGTTGAIGGANTGGGLNGDYGSSSGTTGLGGASGGGSMGSAGGSSTTAFGSGASTGADASVGSGATALPNSSGSGGGASSALSGGVQNLKSQATDKARQAAMQGKDRATDALGNVSTLVRDAAGMIDERLGGGYGEYARKAAGAIDNFSEQLRGKEVDEIFDDAKNLVRKSPGVAIGIAATVGFVLVRALKAGTESSGGSSMGGSGTDTLGSSAANDGATAPYVSDRGGVA